MLFGPNVKQILSSAGVEDIAIAGDPVTIYTRAFKLINCASFSIWLKGAGTTVRLDVYLEQSYRLPTTEGAADSHWAVPEGNSPLINDLADTNAHIVTSIAPAVLPYGRLKIVSNATNGANTTLNAMLGTQSER